MHLVRELKEKTMNSQQMCRKYNIKRKITIVLSKLQKPNLNYNHSCDWSNIRGWFKEKRMMNGWIMILKKKKDEKLNWT